MSKRLGRGNGGGSLRKRMKKSNLKSREDISAQRAVTRINSVLLPDDRQSAETTLVQLKLMQVVASSAGAVINYTVNANPGGYNDWSSYASDYREYRILATRFHYEPNQNMSYATGLTNSNLISVVDRIDTTALTSYSGGFNYASSKVSNTGKSHTRTVKMIGIEDAGFSPTATPVTVWTYKLYADTLTASVNYGRVYTTALVQFRGRY